MSTEAPQVDEIEALEQYAAAYREFKPVKEEWETFQASGKDIKERFDAGFSTMKERVEALGIDPMKVLKGQRSGGGGGTRTHDPSRKQAILDLITNNPLQVRDVVASTGLQTTYVSSVLSNERKAGRVTAEGERPNKTYSYTPPAE